MIWRQFSRISPPARLWARRYHSSKQGHDGLDERWMALGSAMLVLPGVMWIRNRYQSDEPEKTQVLVIPDLKETVDLVEVVPGQIKVVPEQSEVPLLRVYDHVVVGGGEAGQAAVQTLREQGEDVLWVSNTEDFSLNVHDQTMAMASGEVISWHRLLLSVSEPNLDVIQPVLGEKRVGIVSEREDDVDALALACKLAASSTVTLFLREAAPLSGLLPKYLSSWMMARMPFKIHTNVHVEAMKEGFVSELAEGLTGLPPSPHGVQLKAPDGREWWVDQVIQLRHQEVALAERSGLELSLIGGIKRNFIYYPL